MRRKILISLASLLVTVLCFGFDASASKTKKSGAPKKCLPPYSDTANGCCSDK